VNSSVRFLDARPTPNSIAVVKAPRRIAAGLALLVASCAGRTERHRHDLYPPAPHDRAGASTRGAGPGSGSASGADPISRAIAAARGLVGEDTVVVAGVDYGPGCAALVRAALAAAGRPLPAAARDASSIHAVAVARGTLKPMDRAERGDVVFLADRAGGRPAHVGIVERLLEDGTAVVLHRTARGVVPLRVNATLPSRRERPMNDSLLVNGRAVPAGALALAAADLLRG
jgi:hypothetical protein